MQKKSYPLFLVRGAEVHKAYVAALDFYLEVVQKSGKSSRVARRALKAVRNHLVTKKNKDDHFFRACRWYQGPAPHSSQNPLIVGGDYDSIEI